MRRFHRLLLWLMDMTVAVFIGPVDAGKRASRVRRMASRRGAYALAFAGVVVAAATLYTLMARWPSLGA